MKRKPRKANEESRKARAKAADSEELAGPQGCRPKGLAPERAEDLLGQAHEALEQTLRQRLQKFQDRSRVSARELELTVKECVHEVGQDILGRLLDFEPWLDRAHKVTQWECPSCGRLCARAQDQKGQPLYEQRQLHSTMGPVKWRAPLFDCRRCRRLFSPR